LDSAAAEALALAIKASVSLSPFEMLPALDD
jgi:hypothetical protein